VLYPVVCLPLSSILPSRATFFPRFFGAGLTATLAVGVGHLVPPVFLPVFREYPLLALPDDVKHTRVSLRWGRELTLVDCSGGL